MRKLHGISVAVFMMFMVSSLPGHAMANDATAAAGASSTVNAQLNPNFNNNNAAGAAANNTTSVVNTPNNTTGSAAGASVNYAPVSSYTDQNRQFMTTGAPGMPATPQDFSPRADHPWNVVPALLGSFSQGKMHSVDYKELKVHVMESWAPAKTVTFVKEGQYPRSATVGGTIYVLVGSNQTTDDAQEIAFQSAKDNGWDYAEILTNYFRPEPTTAGWSVGLGSGGSAIIGPEGTYGLAGYGGTSFGKTSIHTNYWPFIVVRGWHDGHSTTSANVKPHQIEDNSVLPVKQTPAEFQTVQ